MNLRRGHYAPIMIYLDDDIIDYLQYPWPRLLVWVMKLCARSLARGISYNYGIPQVPVVEEDVQRGNEET